MIASPPNPPSWIRDVDRGAEIAPSVFGQAGNCPNGITYIVTKDTLPGAVAQAAPGSCTIKLNPVVIILPAAWRCTVGMHEFGHAALGFEQHTEKGVMRAVMDFQKDKPHPRCVAWYHNRSECKHLGRRQCQIKMPNTYYRLYIGK